MVIGGFCRSLHRDQNLTGAFPFQKLGTTKRWNGAYGSRLDLADQATEIKTVTAKGRLRKSVSRTAKGRLRKNQQTHSMNISKKGLRKSSQATKSQHDY